MIQIICGEKGKGKTKVMLEQANDSLKDAQGSIVFVDKNAKNMYSLNNQIRLIDITEYPISTYDGFIGFVSGLLSGNHDIECVFFDSFIKIAHIEEADLEKVINDLDELTKDIRFVISISLAKENLPSSIQDKVTVSC
jgi:beta-lactamase class D